MGSNDAVFSREDFLSQDDLVTEDVVMNDYGFKPKPGHDKAIVRIRLMPGKCRDEFEELISSITEQKGGKFIIKSMKDVKVTLIQLCAVDANNQPLFTNDDLQFINEKNSAAIDYLFKRCQDLNKLSDSDVDDMVKNFDLDLSESSGSH